MSIPDVLVQYSSAIGWFAFTMSVGVSLSPIPQFLEIKKRGKLEGENIDPWVSAILYTLACTLYGFSSGSSLQFQIWCVQDMLITSWLLLGVLKVVPPQVYDAFATKFWRFLVAVPMALGFWGSSNAMGYWMMLLGAIHSLSIVTSLGRVLRLRQSHPAIDPLMVFARILAGVSWCIFTYIEFDPFMFAITVWFTMWAVIVLMFYVIFHERVFGLPLAPKIPAVSQAPSDLENPVISVEKHQEGCEAFDYEAIKLCCSPEPSSPTPSRFAPSTSASFDKNNSGPHRTLHFAPKYYHQRKGVSSGGMLECAVCLTGTDESMVVLHCGHRFCPSCLTRCSESELRCCPTCRHPHELDPEVLKKRFEAYRKGYRNWRRGGAKGSKNEVDDISAARASKE